MNEQLEARIWDQLGYRLFRQIRNQVATKFADQLWDQLRVTGGQLWEEIRMDILNQISEDMRNG